MADAGAAIAVSLMIFASMFPLARNLVLASIAFHSLLRSNKAESDGVINAPVEDGGTGGEGSWDLENKNLNNGGHDENHGYEEKPTEAGVGSGSGSGGVGCCRCCCSHCPDSPPPRCCYGTCCAPQEKKNAARLPMVPN